MLRRILAATMVGALVLTAGCALPNLFAHKAEAVTYESVAQSELSPEEKVDTLVANMSDADKVGQLLMILYILLLMVKLMLKLLMIMVLFLWDLI